MVDVSIVECEECGQVALSSNRSHIIEQAEEHADLYPDHQMFLHVLESKDSRKL